MSLGPDDDIDEMDLQSLVDGELTAEKKSTLMKSVHLSPKALARLEDLMLQKLLLKEWWKRRI